MRRDSACRVRPTSRGLHKLFDVTAPPHSPPHETSSQAAARPPGAPGGDAWTTRRLLAWIADAFTKKGLESPRLQAEMLVAHVLGVERLRLYMEADRPASPLERQTLKGLVGRALQDEPIDYLVGERWFYGLPFHVSPAVLVPRPATETIIDQLLLHIRASTAGPGFGTKTGEGTRIADVCTGSGCIAIALMKQLPQATAIATDVSAAALEIARKNAERHQVLARIELLEGDLLEPLRSHPTAPEAHDGAGAGGFHYIVSNPPYIPDREWEDVPPNVRNYEPELALRGGADGLRFVRPIIDQAPRMLRPGGLLVIEIASSTAKEAMELARANAMLDPDTVRIANDLDGLPRVLIAGKRAE